MNKNINFIINPYDGVYNNYKTPIKEIEEKILPKLQF